MAKRKKKLKEKAPVRTLPKEEPAAPAEAEKEPIPAPAAVPDRRTTIVMGAKPAAEKETSVSEAPVSRKDEKRAPKARRKKKKRAKKSKGRVFMRWCIALLLIVMFALDGVVLSRFVVNNILETSFYHANSQKVSGNIRIVQLSDLHNQQFGQDNEQLIRRVAELKPDIILLTGDMVSANIVHSFDDIARLCEALVAIAPTYAVAGNHEATIQYSRPEIDWSIGRLGETGVHVVSRSVERLQIGDDLVLIGGFYRSESAFDSDSYLQEYMAKFNAAEPDALKLLLIHEPNLYVNKLTGYEGVDFVFSGHAHGGHVRLPFIGGLYAPNQGIFPRYVSGMTSFGDTKLLISRGLGNESKIPRIHNKPEILVLDIER